MLNYLGGFRYVLRLKKLPRPTYRFFVCLCTLIPLTSFIDRHGPIAHASTEARIPNWLVSGLYEGSSSLAFSNGTLELTFLTEGASMASVTLRDDADKLNPFWDPVRFNRELDRTASPSSITGHILCLDGFGPISAQERNAGLPFNGEAHTRVFDVQSNKVGLTSEVTLTTTLPIVQEAVKRTYRLVDGENVVYVETQVDNLLGFDRSLTWGEHATVGSPFVEPGITVFDLSGRRSHSTPYTELSTPMDPASQRRLSSDKDFTWPLAPAREGGAVDMRLTPDNPHYVDHVATLMDPSRPFGWTTALNLKRHLILGYIFRREDYPWLQTWVSDPPTMKLVRGMEFATQPFSATRRDAITAGSMYDTPTYRWLPAKSSIKTQFLMFYARVPESIKEVDDVRLENGGIVVEDSANHHVLRIASSQTI